ncbi:hypothetical protein ACWEP4_30740 [Streptomyces sp. NPDC004227]
MGAFFAVAAGVVDFLLGAGDRFVVGRRSGPYDGPAGPQLQCLTRQPLVFCGSDVASSGVDAAREVGASTPVVAAEP